jgi:hypothetical protein
VSEEELAAWQKAHPTLSTAACYLLRRLRLSELLAFFEGKAVGGLPKHVRGHPAS